MSGVPGQTQKPSSQGAKLLTGKLAFAARGKRSGAYLNLSIPASPSAKTAEDSLDSSAHDADLTRSYLRSAGLQQ